MNVHHLFAAILAGAGVTTILPAQDTEYNQVSMCVTTAIGTCGNFCQPADCEPNYTLVSSYENMVVDVAGAPESSYVLFVGLAAPGCLQVPGIQGQLSTWTVAAPLVFGSFDGTIQYDLPCEPAVDAHIVSFPAVPPGVDLRFQLLGINEYGTSQPMLTFSRPVEVRTR